MGRRHNHHTKQKRLPEFATASLRADGIFGEASEQNLTTYKSTDKTIVEWSLRDINKPLGVSSYKLEEVVECTVKELEIKKEKCSQNMIILE